MSANRREFVWRSLAGLCAPAIAGASESRATTAGSTVKSDGDVPTDIGRHFRDHGLEGTFAMLAVHDQTLLLHNEARANMPFSPASTFKIANSLIALETGVIADENQILKWDGEQRPVPEWNKDHSMRSAIAVSAVWFYQELARRIGETRMREWIDRIGYGNRDISGGIDQFWLGKGLRITAREQIEFLRRLYANELPFAARTCRIVKEILVLERTSECVLRGKTGMLGKSGPELGWLVGWVERGERAWIFASNMAMRQDTNAALRKSLPLEILAALRLIEPAR